MYWAERLVWTKLALHLHAILVTVLITLVHVTSTNITTAVAALAVVAVRSSIFEEGVVAKFPLQILNVGIVVEVTWLYLVLIRGLLILLMTIGVLRLLRREVVRVAIVELTTRAQGSQVVSLNIFHLQVWAGSVGWKQTASISLLLFMLFVVQKHLEHVLAMNQLVFEFLSSQKLSLQERSLNI